MKRNQPTRTGGTRRKANWKPIVFLFICAALIIAAVVGLILRHNAKKAKPDLSILWAIDRVSDDTVEAMEERLAGLSGDVNGDGQVVVKIRVSPSFFESIYSPTFVLLSDSSFDLLLLSKRDMLRFFAGTDYLDESWLIANSAFTEVYSVAKYYAGQILWETGDETLLARQENAARVAQQLAIDDGRLIQQQPRTLQTTSDGKIVITLGFLGDRPNCDVEISAFNAAQEEYEIRAVQYKASNDAQSGEECQELLLSDLQAGTGPDIIDLSSFSISPRDERFLPYLADLYPWLDADPDLSREDILASFRDGYEVAGGWYCTVPSLGLRVAVVDSRAAGTGWTLADLSETAAAVGGAEHLSVIRLSDGGDLFSDLFGLYGSDFVDLDRGIAELVTPDYVSLLRVCGEAGPPVEAVDAHDELDPAGVLYFDRIRSFFYPELYAQMFPEGYRYAQHTDGTPATLWRIPAGRLAMADNTLCGDGVWSFLRLFFQADYQLTLDGLPSNPAALEVLAQDALAGKLDNTASWNLFGGEAVVRSRERTPNMPLLEGSLTYGAASRSQVEELWELMNATRTVYESDTEYVRAKLSTVTNDYIQGDIPTPEDAAAEAQRVAEEVLELLREP